MDYVSNPSRLHEYFRDYRALYYYTNKAIRPPAIRDIIFKSIRCFLPKNKAAANPDDLKRLQQDGFALWEQIIDTQTLTRIRNFLSAKPVYDLRNLEQKPLDLSKMNIDCQMKLKYFTADLIQCEDIIKIANDEKIIALVTDYFGCKPTITIIEAQWTKTHPDAAQILFQDDMYHRDVEDFKFVKLFVYLSDVSKENGPHRYIRGSHRTAALTKRMPIPNEMAENGCDPKDVITMTGKAGSGFVEDTWGLHRAVSIESGERLVLTITYSLTALNPQSPTAPMADNQFAVDSYTNRVFFK